MHASEGNLYKSIIPFHEPLKGDNHMHTFVRIADLPFAEARDLSLMYLHPEQVPLKNRPRVRQYLLNFVFPPRCTGINPEFWQTELGLAMGSLAWEEYGKDAIVFRKEHLLFSKLLRIRKPGPLLIAVAAEFLNVYQTFLPARGYIKFVRKDDFDRLQRAITTAEAQKLRRVVYRRRGKKMSRERSLLRLLEKMGGTLPPDPDVNL